MIKRRVQPEDVIINCSKDSEWPKAPAGHKWKEVRHDNTVSKLQFGFRKSSYQKICNQLYYSQKSLGMARSCKSNKTRFIGFFNFIQFRTFRSLGWPLGRRTSRTRSSTSCWTRRLASRAKRTWRSTRRPEGSRTRLQRSERITQQVPFQTTIIWSTE